MPLYAFSAFFGIRETDLIHQHMTLEGHNANVTAVCFHSEGKWLVTASEDQSVCIWDLRFIVCILTRSA